MVENRERRDLLRDVALELLAEEGAHRLTHRRVDQAAGVPTGTAKNYFPTREALMLAAAERSYQRYRQDLAHLEGVAAPTDREGLIALLGQLVRGAVAADRTRMLAYLELHAEATRIAGLRDVLADFAATDLALYDQLQRAAGLPVTDARTRVVTRCVHGALLSWLTQSPRALREAGLDNPEAFLRELFDTVYPH